MNNIDLSRDEIQEYSEFVLRLNKDLMRKRTIVEEQNFLISLLRRMVSLSMTSKLKQTSSKNNYDFIDKYIDTRINILNKFKNKGLITQNEYILNKKIILVDKSKMYIKCLDLLIEKNNSNKILYKKHIKHIENRLVDITKNLTK